MTFKLHIHGRSENQVPPVANSANPLIQIERISGLAELAELAAPEITKTERVRFEKRLAAVSWLGYGDEAEHLAALLLRRDRDLDDRRLCVECSHAGPGWRCAKRDAFLVRQLQRCDNFQEITK